ncbi:MAG: glutamine-hydrolyzing carbamoyl-phosphate synthase small subunit [Candidatus ainarchaeum sp.]|nr:glutamine-hydrolyzing carbamoyl-phosphate synthase small subunit [Candidatus ainarchaeum sp.]
MVEAAGLKGILVLSDGSFFEGPGFGAEGTALGELVFNTAMTGYQEALTDPSYAGQILMMAYPLIGNYGVSEEDYESRKIHAPAFVVREACGLPVHMGSVETIHSFLERNGTQGLEGVDTRALVRKVRTRGVMPACVQVYSGKTKPDVEALAAKANALDYSKINFVEKVSAAGRVDVAPAKPDSRTKKVALIDCGAKESIARDLTMRNISVSILPWNASTGEILACEPDGLIISNGPGDPTLLSNVAEAVKPLLEKIPVFGICLGHQIIGHAVGGKTFKMKFGHRGANHPVKCLEDGKVYITSQNHGFAVDGKTLPREYEESYCNLNDRTNEGFRHRELPVSTVQFHPEANPGPLDKNALFDRFRKVLEEY